VLVAWDTERRQSPVDDRVPVRRLLACAVTSRCVFAAGMPAPGLWLLALAAGCGPGPVADPTVVPLASWPAEQAAIVCAKIAGCCDGVERMKFFYVNDAQCRAMQADIRSGVNNLIAQGQPVAYNGKAARRCLDEMKATSCVALFNHPEVNVSWPSCDEVAPGTGKLGAPCGGFDMFCESANCLLESSTCGPPRGCSPSCDGGQYCDEGAGRCVPVKMDGEFCSLNPECAPPSVCIDHACAAPLGDGAYCFADTDCAAGTCVRGICGPLLPNGGACSFDRDCASGACVGPDPASRACGAPLPDGAECMNDSACASGTCVGRTTFGPLTCGPPFCDGV
jgi:hypothetical protein